MRRSSINASIHAMILALVPACFFLPSVAVGGRKIFLFDALTFAMAGLLLWAQRQRLRERKGMWWFFGLTLLCWLHGALRPSGHLGFDMFLLVELREDLRFRFFREFIVGMRIFIWATAAGALLEHVKALPRNERADLQRKSVLVAGACMAVAVLCAFWGQASPAFRETLSRFYHYPLSWEWEKRSFGVFASPVEAGAAYAFLVFIFLFHAADRKARLALVAAGAAGAFATRSLTPFLGVCAAAALAAFDRLGRRKKRSIPAAAGGLLLLVGLVLLFVAYSDYANKVANFSHRTQVWAAYLDVLSTRADHLLLGIGFLPVHADSTFVFVASRYGLVGVFSALLCLSRPVARAWDGEPLLRYLVPFGAVTALATDFWVFRPVIAVLLGTYIPLIAKREPAR